MIIDIYLEFGTQAYYILKKYEYRFYVPNKNILSNPVIKEFYKTYGDKAKIFFEKRKGKLCYNKNAAVGLRKFLVFEMHKKLNSIIFDKQIKEIQDNVGFVI